MSHVISYRNVYTNEVNFVYEDLYGILGGAWWADERNIVWAYQEGIFMTNIDSIRNNNNRKYLYCSNQKFIT